ncbi:hypothetical protein [Leifsonia sp. Leaf264]|uniref:hypothetical protein n=1 Tax=Leifsonia sp. Leaf264 TaxID=1736314 RepID=UPI0006FA6EC6|nr:hypothetical protein [Leifsonia sp. Leaf264]KQO98371.1 hypothetical protein ASF30_09940 [Leifsonia sp. Leaf264]
MTDGFTSRAVQPEDYPHIADALRSTLDRNDITSAIVRHRITLAIIALEQVISQSDGTATADVSRPCGASTTSAG